VTRATAGKDLRVLWTSPIPYVVAALFHAVVAVLYVSQLEDRRQALMQPFFPIAGFMLVVLVPVLAMRTLAEEARAGTLDLLLAVPVATRPLVAGKWLATWATSLAVLAPAALFAPILRWFGHPDSGPIVTGFAGLVLLTAALTGIGVLASSLTASQPVAAMVALFVSLALWFAHRGTASAGVAGVLARFSTSDRLRSFAGGAVHTADVGFFVAVAAGALVLAAAAVDSRRLR